MTIATALIGTGLFSRDVYTSLLRCRSHAKKAATLKTLA
jgi:hypothetical protein